jgi:PleD family two-component response regulator
MVHSGENYQKRPAHKQSDDSDVSSPISSNSININIAPLARKQNPEQILIIYDNSGQQRTLCQTLAPADCDVVTAAYGPRAMDALRSTKPGLVILDVYLTGKIICGSLSPY